MQDLFYFTTNSNDYGDDRDDDDGSLINNEFMMTRAAMRGGFVQCMGCNLGRDGRIVLVPGKVVLNAWGFGREWEIIPTEITREGAREMSKQNG